MHLNINAYMCTIINFIKLTGSKNCSMNFTFSFEFNFMFACPSILKLLLATHTLPTSGVER